MNIFTKIQCKLIKFRLQAIRVFCLHHVCEQFDVESMYPCDWMELSIFKSKIIDLQKQGYEFVSLSEAHKHLKNDFVRIKKYAVLTFDDGYKTLLEVLPWLEEQNIPATLFINGKYIDGKSYRETPEEKYLTYDELFALISPLIEIGHHGWEHKSVDKMSEAERIESMQKNIEILSSHPRYIPFWAYTYGKHSNESDMIITQNNLVPVLVAGNRNYQWMGYIDRELL